MTPTWRKPVGVLLILLFIVLWSILAVTVIGLLSSWPILLQMPVYAIAGIAWIFPMRPMLLWMETGRWR